MLWQSNPGFLQQMACFKPLSCIAIMLNSSVVTMVKEIHNKNTFMVLKDSCVIFFCGCHHVKSLLEVTMGVSSS